MPMFSVMIPVYNMEKYLNRCIDSIINQSYNDIEVILVDDGSQDSSPKICDEYALEYSFIRVIHKKNEGLLMARRTAIREAQGEYFVFLDADDYLSNSYFKSLESVIKKEKCDLIFFGYNLVDSRDNIIRSVIDIYKNTRFGIDDKDQLLLDLISDKITYMWQKVVQRDCVDIENTYYEFKDVKDGEDILQSIAIISKIKKAVYLNKALYNYRCLLNSMSKDIDANYLIQFIRVRGLVGKALRTNDVNTEFYQRIMYTARRIFWHYHRARMPFGEYKKLWNYLLESELYSTANRFISQNMKDQMVEWFLSPQLFYAARCLSKIYFMKRYILEKISKWGDKS